MEMNTAGMQYQANFPLGFAPAEPAATPQPVTTNAQLAESCKPGCTFQKRWSLLNELRQRHEYCDLMLVSSDKVTFQAHSIVLASSSSFLHTAIQTLRSESYSTSGPQKLSIDGVGSDVLGIVLDCLYGVMPSTLEGMLKLRMGAEALGLNSYFWPESTNKTVTIEQTADGVQQTPPKSSQYVEEEADEVSAAARTSDGLPLVLAGTSKQREDKTLTEDEDDDAYVILKMDTEDDDEMEDKENNSAPCSAKSTPDTTDDMPEVIDKKLSSKPIVKLEVMDQVHDDEKPGLDRSLSDSEAEELPEEEVDSDQPDSVQTDEQEYDDDAERLAYDEMMEFDDEFSSVIVKQEPEEEDEYFVRIYQDGVPLCRCVKCDAIAEEDTTILKHYLMEHKDYVECQLCHCLAENATILQSHIDEEHPAQKYLKSCKTCSLQFNDKESYANHLMIHKKEARDPVCGKCGKKFKGLANLRRHELVIHGEGNDQPAICQICGKSFKCSLYLSDHIRTAHATNKFECDCGRSYKNMKAFTKHREECEVVLHRLFDKTDDFQELVEGAEVSEVGDVSEVIEDEGLRRQLEANVQLTPQAPPKPDVSATLTPIQEDRLKKYGVKSFSTPYLTDEKGIGYKCNMCEYKSKHNTTVQRHYLLIHNGYVRCVTCSAVYETQAILDEHIENKHRKIYICTDCDEQFFSFESLRSHKRRAHGIFNNECRDCNLTFDSLDTYERHLAGVHDIVYSGKPICKYCNAHLSSVRNLRKHVMCLHSVSNCMCDLCGKVYKNKYYLADHKRTSHREDRLQCPCGKTLKSQISLDRHTGSCKMTQQNLQGQNLVLMCSVCRKTFTCKNYLHKHMLRAHPETITRCQCGRRFKNYEAYERHISNCPVSKG